MPEPTTCFAVRNRDDTRYCDRCDLLVGLPGLRVIKVDTADDGVLVVTVESPRTGNVQGCRECGVIAESLGRVTVGLVDAPAMGRRVRVVWRKRRWRCLESACQVGSFVEQDEQVAAPRAALTVRACRWAIGQIRREHASVNGVRRQLGGGLVDVVVGDPADARRGRQGPCPVRRCHHPGGRRTRVASRVNEGPRARRPGPEGAHRNG